MSFITDMLGEYVPYIDPVTGDTAVNFGYISNAVLIILCAVGVLYLLWMIIKGIFWSR